MVSRRRPSPLYSIGIDRFASVYRLTDLLAVSPVPEPYRLVRAPGGERSPSGLNAAVVTWSWCPRSGLAVLLAVEVSKMRMSLPLPQTYDPPTVGTDGAGEVVGGIQDDGLADLFAGFGVQQLQARCRRGRAFAGPAAVAQHPIVDERHAAIQDSVAPHGAKQLRIRIGIVGLHRVPGDRNDAIASAREGDLRHLVGQYQRYPDRLTVRASQSRIALSLPPVAIRFPSGLKATDRIVPKFAKSGVPIVAPVSAFRSHSGGAGSRAGWSIGWWQRCDCRDRKRCR